MISRQKQFIFVHNPKCAGSSIKWAFTQQVDDLKADNWHYTISELSKKAGDTTNFFSFGFCRNPYDRLVSAFCYNMKMMEDSDNYHWDVYPNAYRILSEYQTTSRVDSFKAFVNGPDFKRVFSPGWPIHFKTQAHFLATDGELCLSFVGRYENLHADMRLILERLKLDSSVVVPHINQSTQQSYRSFYDGQTKFRVIDLYAEDFELFGYEQ